MSLRSGFGSLGAALLRGLLCALAGLGRRHQGLMGSAGVRRQQQPQLHQPSAPSPGACTSQGTGEGLATVFVGSSSSETNGRAKFHFLQSARCREADGLAAACQVRRGVSGVV